MKCPDIDSTDCSLDLAGKCRRRSRIHIEQCSDVVWRRSFCCFASAKRRHWKFVVDWRGEVSVLVTTDWVHTRVTTYARRCTRLSSGRRSHLKDDCLRPALSLYSYLFDVDADLVCGDRDSATEHGLSLTLNICHVSAQLSTCCELLKPSLAICVFMRGRCLHR